MSSFRRNKKRITRQEYDRTVRILNKDIQEEDAQNEEQESELILHDLRLSTLETKITQIEQEDTDVINLENRIAYLEQVIQSLLNL